MRFLIASTYTDGLAALTQDEQNLAKQRHVDFLRDPSLPSLKFHRIHNTKDSGFWSFRVNKDIRTVIYKQGQDFIYCYIDHHDAAYQWAQNRKMETHPKTGAAQLVQISERIEEVIRYKEVLKEPPLFDRYDPDYLLALGVPTQWLQAVRHVGTEGLLKLFDRLPEEASENLMLLAAGEPVATPTPIIGGDPFLHPDAQRRFAVVDPNEAELHQALSYPLDKWMVFLHPKQQAPVQKEYGGPAKISGGAGTGKTVVALHRAAYLARRDPHATLLLTTFSRALAGRLSYALDQLLGTDSPERQRIHVTHLHQLAREYYPHPFTSLSDKTLRTEIEQAKRSSGEDDFSTGFLAAEWQHVIDAYDISTFKDYRSFNRIGRGTPLQVKQRMSVWTVLDKVRQSLEQQQLMSYERLSHRAAAALEARESAPFTHVIADEVQDFGPAELRLLRALAPTGPNDLMLVGDNGQRIYKARSSLKASGIDVVGRASILRLNYRTTEQIRRRADAILPKELVDLDGSTEARTTVSLLYGPEPELDAFSSPQEEIQAVAEQLGYYLTNGFKPRDIALFTRTHHLLEERAQAALALSGYRGELLSEDATPSPDYVSLGTMHRAKGLEFKIVFVMGCEAGVIPLPSALAAAPDEAEQKLVIEQERNLLYVAATRARERLMISYAGAPSDFLTSLTS